MSVASARPSPSPTGTAPHRSPRAHPVDLVFGAVWIGSMAYWFSQARDSWFWIDEWVMAWQVRDLGNLIEPYNEHLSIIILGLYRLLLNVVGFSTYTPYRIAGILSLGAVSLAMFLHARRLVGPGLAALMALLLLWQRDISFEPGGLNHSLALASGIACAAGLIGRERRHDVLVAASLTVALLSAGGGVAVAVAAVVHTVCSRGTLTRWLGVLVPAVAWGVWWRLMVPSDSDDLAAIRPDTVELASGALSNAAKSFSSLALGNRVAGGVLLVAFVVHGVWRLRQGLVAAANVLAWSAGLYVWWFGLMRSRWLFLGDVTTFRYELFSVAFILLALLPPTRLAWVDRLSADARRRWAVTAGVLVLAAVLVVAVRPDLERFARLQSVLGGQVRARAALIAIQPPVVPDDVQENLALGALYAGQVRELLRTYDRPAFLRAPDRLVLEAARTRLRQELTDVAPPGCTPLEATQGIAPDQRVVLHGPSGSLVEARRFGEEWLPIGPLPAGGSASLSLPSGGVAADWTVRAGGACMTVAGPT